MDLRNRSFVGIVGVIAGAMLFACASARAPGELPTAPDSSENSSSGDDEYPEDLEEQPGDEQPGKDQEEDPTTPDDPADPQADAGGGGSDGGQPPVQAQGTKLVQRYSCMTEPVAGSTFCKNKGFTRGSITKAGACFRLEEFNVKDIEYTCIK